MKMKAITKLIEKIGADKALHFTTGAAIDAMLLPFGKEYTILGIVFVWMISCTKELFDSFEEGNKCDWWDAIAGTIGAACMCGWCYVV